MDPNDEYDLDKLIQEELDALTLDGSLEDADEESDERDADRQAETKEVANERVLNETRRNLEKEMHERLAAFEKESKVNMDRCEIDYSEIDELLRKPVGGSTKEIHNNVARQCGIERQELDRILESIKTEELPPDSMMHSDSDDDDRQKIEFIRRSIQKPVETVESVEPTPREQDDPNKQLYDDRLIESHQRMLDELALLEQRRKEEEERYAVVLQEQQARLAEEYRRLQDTLDEKARQTEHEKLQFQSLCREQERLTKDRQQKMAVVIQAWYRGRRVHRQYHQEIAKRAEPALRAIAKKRKRKEQIDAANAIKPGKIPRTDRSEKENQKQTETTAIPLPTSNRISSPLTDLGAKQANRAQKLQPLPAISAALPKEDSTNKKKIASKRASNTPSPVTQILQLENPADFMPTVIPEQVNTLAPDHHRNNIPAKQQRIKSPNKRLPPAKAEPGTTSHLPTAQKTLPTSKQPTMVPMKATSTSIPSTTNYLAQSLARSNTFDKNIESPTSPSVENVSMATSLTRSRTFDKEMENFQRPSIERISTAKSIDSTSSASLKRSNTFVNQSTNTLLRIGSISPRKPLSTTTASSENKSEPPSGPVETKSDSRPLPAANVPPLQSIDVAPKQVENKFDATTNHSNLVFSVDASAATAKSTDSSSVSFPPSAKQTETIPIKAEHPSTPRVSTPRKVIVEEKRATQEIYPFLNDAHRWAEHTRDMSYANLIRSTEEANQQLPTRKTGAAIRKLPDIDSQLITKAAKNQSPKELRYLLLEKLLNPCSLSLLGAMCPHLTHLTLRQCKLTQLSGLDSCQSLTILDLEGNWLEQIHIQLNHLEFLNVSRNRLTSVLSIQAPNLKYLDASKNRLTRLNGIELFPNLNILLAMSNQLLTTIGLQGCTHLLHIDLSDNHLVEMEQLEQCPLLITVKATSNTLIQIPPLTNAILLNELDLSSNSLTAFDELLSGSWLPFLTHLRLTSNSLQELSPIKLPALNELDLAFNQLSDASVVKRFLKSCPALARLNLEQNPVLCDIDETLLTDKKSSTTPLSVLPHFSTNKSSESIQSYLTFLSNMTSMLIKLRQTIEQHQSEPFNLLRSIQNQCQRYSEQKKIEPIEMPEEIAPATKAKVLSPKEQGIIRLQAHWRRRLLERTMSRQQRAAQKIQACWRGFALRHRLRTVRRFHSQQQQTFDEIDLTQFDFDEAAFDARFQRPPTPAARIREVWQSQHGILPTPISLADLSRPNSARASSAASSRAKPLVEPLDMSVRPLMMTNEWGFTPSSSTAALMLKRAQKMKWNAERRHQRQNMNAFQRLQMARNSEQPPGSLRLARRKQSLTNAAKPVAHAQTLPPPTVPQARPNRVYEWVHTQVARIDDSGLPNASSPNYERKRLPSLAGSTDSGYRPRTSELVQQPQNRWGSSTMSIRQPPPLLPPINGQFPRF